MPQLLNRPTFFICLLTAGILSAADAQNGSNAIAAKPITFNVIATDHRGEPVTDLQPRDLHILDSKTSQPVSLLNPIQNKRPLPVVILFDLVDLSFEQRGVVVRSLRDSLAKLPFSLPAYLYILQKAAKCCRSFR